MRLAGRQRQNGGQSSLADASNGQAVLPVFLWRRRRELPDHLTRLVPLNFQAKTDPSLRPSPLRKGRGGIVASFPGKHGSWVGVGRGGPSYFAMLLFVAIFQRVAAPIYLARWLRTTASSPCPSPPKEERKMTPWPVNTEMRVRSSEDRRTPVVRPRCGHRWVRCSTGPGRGGRLDRRVVDDSHYSKLST